MDKHAWLMIRLIALLCILSVVSPLYGQGTVNDAREREELSVSNYKVVPIAVEHVESNDFGITQDGIKTRTELRVRSAGLKPAAVDVGNDEH